MDPRFFNVPAAFRDWLEVNHDRAKELLVGFYKAGSEKAGITYAEALDEALCYGWIDGVRRSRDKESYAIRFAPRRPGSVWSNVNVRHAERLIREGRMQPAGARVFESRSRRRTGLYSFENKPQELTPALERDFRGQPEAWAFFQQQPPGYRRTVLWWVLSAKLEATQRRRLAQVMMDSAAGRRVDLMSPFRSKT